MSTALIADVNCEVTHGERDLLNVRDERWVKRTDRTGKCVVSYVACLGCLRIKYMRSYKYWG